MKKTLAVLATVATVAATTMTAPAQARGIGPGLAFGLGAVPQLVVSTWTDVFPPAVGFHFKEGWPRSLPDFRHDSLGSSH